MTDLGHILAINIRKRRQSLGFSQAKLAEMANTATTYIALIELEQRSPSFKMIEQIALALEIDPSELFLKVPRPVEEIKQFHASVLEDFEKVLKNRIKKFTDKIDTNNCTKSGEDK